MLQRCLDTRPGRRRHCCCRGKLGTLYGREKQRGEGRSRRGSVDELPREIEPNRRRSGVYKRNSEAKGVRLYNLRAILRKCDDQMMPANILSNPVDLKHNTCKNRTQRKDESLLAPSSPKSHLLERHGCRKVVVNPGR